MSSSLAALTQWVEEVARLTKPDHIHWCTGSDEEHRALTARMVADGILIPLNPETHPNCHLHRSLGVRRGARRAPDLRVHAAREDAGPNNHWMAPDEAHADRCAVRRLHEGPHPVRSAVLHGTDRLAHRALWRGDHRFSPMWWPTCA
jgi:GTP-dependent phosphoenolpyruvate carboxykinase